MRNTVQHWFVLIKEYGGLFQSPWILQLLAGHYVGISDAIRILELESIYYSAEEQASLEIKLAHLGLGSKEALKVAIKLDVMQMYPRGALALCIIAVLFYNCLTTNIFLIYLIIIINFRSSSLKMFTVLDNLSLATFSEKWNIQKRKYQKVINTKLQVALMEEIVLKVCRYMKTNMFISTSIAVLSDFNDEEVDDIDMFIDI